MGRNVHHEFAVIGLGRFGSSLARELTRHGYQVLGIDRSMALVQELSDECTQTVALDASDEDALRDVDIASFDTVIVAIGTNFEANLLATVACKNLGVRQVICKATTERQKMILLRVGADRVVLPEYEAGRRLAHELAMPNVLDHLDLGEGHIVIELRTPSSLAGRTIEDAAIRRRFGVTLLAIKRANDLVVSPASSEVLLAPDILVLLGTNEKIAELSDLP